MSKNIITMRFNIRDKEKFLEFMKKILGWQRYSNGDPIPNEVIDNIGAYCDASSWSDKFKEAKLLEELVSVYEDNSEYYEDVEDQINLLNKKLREL
jgi:hypothetical protein